MHQDIGIIGGADGPTAVFVAGNLAEILIPVILVAAAVIVGVIVLMKKKRNHN
jgi:Na+-transporting methylmalonyl-CoA/oxaloacetate decarboxylase beta subunit